MPADLPKFRQQSLFAWWSLVTPRLYRRGVKIRERGPNPLADMDPRGSKSAGTPGLPSGWAGDYTHKWWRHVVQYLGTDSCIGQAWLDPAPGLHKGPAESCLTTWAGARTTHQAQLSNSKWFISLFVSPCISIILIMLILADYSLHMSLQLGSFAIKHCNSSGSAPTNPRVLHHSFLRSQRRTAGPKL